MKATPKHTLLATTVLACVLLAPGLALAAPEHEVSIKLELVDEGAPGSCADTSISVTAASCDGSEILAELNSKLDDFAFGTVICGFVFPSDEWQCAFSEPRGCDFADIDLRGLVGTDCADDSVTVRVEPFVGGIGGVGFSLD